jgi:hypothetical protein
MNLIFPNKFIKLTCLFALVWFISSCDKAGNAYPKTGSSGLDWSLYPGGDSLDYVTQGYWPTFSPSTNTLRNVLIEDFTGHHCANCPASTANMESLIATNPARIFGVGIHSGPSGLTSFQSTSSDFPKVLYCDEGLEIGTFFGSIPGSAFIGNPSFLVNRVQAAGQYNSSAGSAIADKTNNCLSSTLKVNIQAEVNYFPSTRGVFLHTEVDKIDQTITSDLGLTVYLIEDSLVAKQQLVGSTDDNYVHRDILRGCIDGSAFGKTLTADYLNVNGKYYVNYAYRLPDQYNPDNMHLVIYVYNKTTYEIYQVIKEHLN